jgi:hypothetical protein
MQSLPFRREAYHEVPDPVIGDPATGGDPALAGGRASLSARTAVAPYELITAG